MNSTPTTKRFQWRLISLTVAFFIHSIEEMCTIQWYLQTRLDAVALPEFMRDMVRLSPVQLVPGTALSCIVLLTVCIIGYRRRLQGIAGVLTAGVAAAIFANSAAHALEAAVLCHYVPGLVSSLLLCIPMTIMLFRFFILEKMISYRMLGLMTVGAALLQVPWALCVYFMGSFIR